MAYEANNKRLSQAERGLKNTKCTPKTNCTEPMDLQKYMIVMEKSSVKSYYLNGNLIKTIDEDGKEII
jgi:hypothetical protein